MKHIVFFVLLLAAIASHAQFKLGFGPECPYNKYDPPFINTSKNLVNINTIWWQSEFFVPLGNRFSFAAQNASYDESIMFYFDNVFEDLDIGGLGLAAVIINRTDLMVKRNLLKKKFFSFDVFMGPSIIEANQ